VTGRLGIVFFDVGGPIYDDVWYGRAVLAALRELGGDVDEAEFWREVDRRRAAQAGMTAPLTRRFLGPAADPNEVAAIAQRSWRYPPEALYDDVLPTLERVSRRRRIGLLANQPAATRTALERDGVAPYIDLWILSDEVGFAKPDPRIFAHAVRAAGCAPHDAAYVGNRLDNDIRPARAAGMHTVWLLRGEAPSRPTPAQLAEPDVAIDDLAALPAALDRLERAA
jgi:putative hydrolase of the HAD superfamily